MTAPPLVRNLPNPASSVFKPRDMPDTKVALVAPVAILKLLVSGFQVKVNASVPVATRSTVVLGVTEVLVQPVLTLTAAFIYPANAVN